jgi:ferrous iron transport protein A
MKIQVSLSSFVCLEKIHTMLKKLSELEIGQVATIRQFEDDEVFLKLMEMGFIPGEKVAIEQVAPLGDPIAILISGYQVSLRLNEASKIMVEPI